MPGQINPDLETQLRNQPEMRIAMREAAVAAQQAAVQLGGSIGKGPWMPRTGRTWAAALQVEQQDEGRTVALVNKDYGGHLIEWGSRNNPPYALLRRSVRAVGLRLNSGA